MKICISCSPSYACMLLNLVCLFIAPNHLALAPPADNNKHRETLTCITVHLLKNKECIIVWVVMSLDSTGSVRVLLSITSLLMSLLQNIVSICEKSQTEWERVFMASVGGWLMSVSQLLCVFTHDAYFSVYLSSAHEASFHTQIQFLCAYDYVTAHMHAMYVLSELLILSS